MAAKKQNTSDNFDENRSFSREDLKSMETGKPINPVSESTESAFEDGDRSFNNETSPDSQPRGRKGRK